MGETLEASGQWEITEQPVERGKHCCDEISHVCHIIVQTEDSAQAGAKGGNRCGGNKGKCNANKQVISSKRAMAALPRLLVFLPGWLPLQHCAGSARQTGFYAEWTHGMNP